jgi:hypothetical protein
VGENTERFFLQEWCRETTAAIDRIQEDVTDIRMTQSMQGGRIKALEKTERTAKWAIRGTVTAAFLLAIDYVRKKIGI